MLTARQEKLIRSLETKKGRHESGLCLVEGEKNLIEAKDFIDFAFTPNDSDKFRQLISTDTPPKTAAVARIPLSTLEDISTRPVIVVLDGVQDPGNVGSILRLCLGFNASLLLIESADPTSPKVVRSSAGAFFKTPWLELKRDEAENIITSLQRPIYRMEISEKKNNNLKAFTEEKEVILIAGSEGQGIKLSLNGDSLEIPHEKILESLNVAAALAITLSQYYSKNKS